MRRIRFKVVITAFVLLVSGLAFYVYTQLELNYDGQMLLVIEMAAVQPKLVEIAGWLDNDGFVAIIGSNKIMESFIVNASSGEVE